MSAVFSSGDEIITIFRPSPPSKLDGQIVNSTAVGKNTGPTTMVPSKKRARVSASGKVAIISVVPLKHTAAKHSRAANTHQQVAHPNKMQAEVTFGLAPCIDIGDSQMMYELKSASALPTINLERTILSLTWLPLSTQAQLANVIQTRHRVMYLIIRFALGVFAILIFTPVWVPGGLAAVSIVSMLILVIATPPLLALLALSSVDMLSMLLRTYECWFVSIINSVHWLCVAHILGLPRGVLCIVGWLSIQSIAMIDANFHGSSVASKAALTTIPLLLVLAIACGVGLASDARFTLISVSRDFPIDTGSVVVFTACTLAIFMAKKVYVTRHQLRECELSLARFRVVSCVVVKGSLRLRPWRSGRRVAMIGGARLRQGTTINRILSGAMQPIRGSSHWSTSFVVDAKRTFLPVVRWICAGNARKSFGVHTASNGVWLLGIVGFTLSVCTWLSLLFPHSDWLDETKLQLGLVAVICSHFYVLVCFILSHRDMVLALVTNFDVMFSAFQLHALAVCMMDMVRWRPHGCAAVTAWWLWFNWIFLLDSMTPPVQSFVRSRRGFALAVAVWVLVVTAAVMVLILADSELLADRTVWRLQWLGARPFELHTKDFAMQRIATILGWNTRLAIELARPQHHEELLFIRQPLEYSCPVRMGPVVPSPPPPPCTARRPPRSSSQVSPADLEYHSSYTISN